jgi:hypothetical protein
MTTKDLKRGCLVKNTRSDEIGVIVTDEPDCTNSDSQYYKVLTDGKIVSWFKPNIEIYNERAARAFTKRMVR